MAKFDLKYPHLHHLEMSEDDAVLYSDDHGPCFVCGCDTHYIEINYQAWLCSEECERMLDEEYRDAENAASEGAAAVLPFG